LKEAANRTDGKEGLVEEDAEPREVTSSATSAGASRNHKSREKALDIEEKPSSVIPVARTSPFSESEQKEVATVAGQIAEGLLRVDVEEESDWDFFISYTQADREWAEWIAWQLDDAGFKVIVQSWHMVPGRNFVVAMEEASGRSKRTIAVLSPDYLKSVYGKTEWQAAFNRDPSGFERRLVPIRVRECDRPGVLGSIVSFDIFDVDVEEVARRQLLRGIRAAVEGQDKPATPPLFPGSRTRRDYQAQPATPVGQAVPGRKPDFPLSD
jgi:hypothetical protein